MINDDEELGDQFLLEDDDEEEEVVAALAKDKKKKKKRKNKAEAPPSVPLPLSAKKRKKRNFDSEIWTLSPRFWSPAQWGEWLLALRPSTSVDLASVAVSEVDLPRALGETASKKKLGAIVVCGSALRCADVAKGLKAKGFTVLKLFGKHLKLQDQVETLKLDRLATVAVGTPSRLEALSEHLDHKWPFSFSGQQNFILVDADPDQKNYTPLTLAEAKYPLARFIENILKQPQHAPLRIATTTFKNKTTPPDDAAAADDDDD